MSLSLSLNSLNNERYINLIRTKMEMVQHEGRQLNEAVDSYLNHILKLGQLYVDSQDRSEMNFKEISMGMENAALFLGEMAAEFLSKVGPVSQPESLAETIVDGPYESSCSMSFEVLQQSPIGGIKSVADFVAQPNVSEHQVKVFSAKLDTLSNTLVRVISDLNSLKKQVGPESSRETKVPESLSLEDNEKFVELKKHYSALSEEQESLSKQVERVNKELAAYKNDNKDKQNILDGRLSILEAKFVGTDSDVKTKVTALEKEWNKFAINTKTLEHRVNKSENCLNDLDLRLTQLQEMTDAVVQEKEKKMSLMSEEIQKASLEMAAIKGGGGDRADVSLNDALSTVKALEILVKEDLQKKIAGLERPVRKLERMNIDKTLKEQKSLLSDVISSQSQLGSRIQEIEKKIKPPQVMPIEQQYSFMKIGTRVRRGPNWSTVLHGDIDGPPPGQGTITNEITPYKKFRVKWDTGYENSYSMDPDNKYFEIQLAFPPQVD